MHAHGELLNQTKMTINIFRSLKQLLTLALLGGVATLANAENLVSMKTVAMPAFAGTPSDVFVASNVPVIVQGNLLWRLDESRKEWIELAWRPSGRIRGTVENGPRPYLLLESEEGNGISHVASYPLPNVPPEKVLPALPLRFSQAKGAVLGGVVYLAGISMDGTSHWLSIDPKSPEPVWGKLLAWGANSPGITAVVAQDSALYVTVRESVGEGDKVWRWAPGDRWSERGILPGSVVEGSARAIGQAHVMMLVRPGTSAAANAGSQFITYHTITGSFSNQGAS
ncbi:MAG: hypothetical protein ABI790_15495, partial [Betaproteobacteria bacterium]